MWAEIAETKMWLPGVYVTCHGIEIIILIGELFLMVFHRKRKADKYDLHWTNCNTCKRVLAMSDGYDKTKLMREDYKHHMVFCKMKYNEYPTIKRWKVFR